MSDQPHAWALARYNTAKLRAVASKAQHGMSGITLPDGRRNDNDDLLSECMQALAVAADHIDRLEHVRGPHFVATSCAVLPAEVEDAQDDVSAVFLFATDTMGNVWQHSFGDNAWLPLSSAVLVPIDAPEDQPTSRPN